MLCNYKIKVNHYARLIYESDTQVRKSIESLDKFFKNFFDKIEKGKKSKERFTFVTSISFEIMESEFPLVSEIIFPNVKLLWDIPDEENEVFRGEEEVDVEEDNTLQEEDDEAYEDQLLRALGLSREGLLSGQRYTTESIYTTGESTSSTEDPIVHSESKSTRWCTKNQWKGLLAHTSNSKRFTLEPNTP